jgi:transcriptional/translational regulatory protein YebC/TACO1
MFDQKGVVTLVGPVDEDALLEASLEGGAETYELIELDEDTAGVDVFCSPNDLEQLDTTLKTHGYQVRQSELRWIPSNTIMVEDSDQARLLLKLMDALEDLDDIQSVTANFDMTDDLMATVAA